MKANRCNRCLGYYIPEEENEQTCEITSVYFHNGEDVKRRHFCEVMGDIDLCPKCTLDFRRFMQGCPMKIDDNDFDRPDQPNPA